MFSEFKKLKFSKKKSINSFSEKLILEKIIKIGKKILIPNKSSIETKKIIKRSFMSCFF